MTTHLLTKEEYNSTFTEKMIDVTTTVDPVVDIWLYVEQLVVENVVGQETLDNGLIELVYRNHKNTFDHVLLPTPSKNVFIVIIIDILNTLIKGHYLLNLNDEYGLN